MDDKVSYWLEIADYDLETAEAMLRTKRLLYVGFMCHQSIEKALKAALASQGKTPPFTHNLGRLAEARGVYEQMSEEQRDLLDNLEPLNIQSRYPDEKGQMLLSLTVDRGAELIRQTKELYEWIRARL